MAAITESTAQSLAASRQDAHTYIEAYAGKTKANGSVWCIHALMPVTSTGGGNWTEVTDDA